MKFNEELAAEIADKNKLSKSHINKWRFRGQIPDKYFLKKEYPRDNIEEDKLRKILASDKINIEMLSRLTKISRGRIENFSRRGDTFTDPEILQLKKALSEIKINAKKIVSFLEKYPRAGMIAEKEAKKIIALRMFYVKNVCDDILAGVKISEWVRGKRNDFPGDVKSIFLTGLLVFTTEINL